MKAQFVIDLLKSNGNRFTPAQLEAATGTARRARRALFLARRDLGIKLEAVRDAGRAVTAATPKASKGSAKAKVAPAPKVKAAKPVKTPKVKAVKEVDVSRISDEAKAAIKAKNLETMKAVSAKTKRLHPVTKRPLTAEQADVLDEFAALEKQAELEEIRAEENAALRANAPSFLFKESYSE